MIKKIRKSILKELIKKEVLERLKGKLPRFKINKIIKNTYLRSLRNNVRNNNPGNA